MIPLLSCAILASAILTITLIDRGLPNCARAVAIRLLKYAARADVRQSARRAAHLTLLSNLAATARLTHSADLALASAVPSCDPPPFLLGDPTLPRGTVIRISSSTVRNRAHVNGQST